MIEIKNLNYKDILSGINMEIETGDILLITGPNGSGKSTLINCILGINKIAHNTITIDGKCINCYKTFEKIGYVKQVDKRVYELPITVSEYLSLFSTEHKRRDSLVKQFKIEGVLNNSLNSLSGGEKQKVNIIKSLLNNIDYLILDEPETGLDKKSRKELNNIIVDLNKRGITIIIISHYVEHIDNFVSARYDLDNKNFERLKNVTV